MSKVIMIGCDLHLRSMTLAYCVDQGPPQQASFVNDASGREKMLGLLGALAKKNDVRRTVFAYEASSVGYGLSDQLHDAGIECHVLSPAQLPKSPKQDRQKTDAKDAQMLLDLVRAHVLAGNSLPVVWTPPQRLRDDRELVRARIDGADETTRIKLRILSMLKRRRIETPRGQTRFSKRFVKWLYELAATLDPCVGVVLEQWIERYELSLKQQGALDKALHQLSQTERYRHPAAKLREMPGVGLLSAMTFLTEMGDLTRFENRREVTAYLGLCPSSYESGDSDDRKGHITRQGPARVRRLLCQATWVGIRECDEVGQAYQRIRGGKKNRTKKALVAMMRQLAIKMWHHALSMGVSIELHGRGGPHSLQEGKHAA